MRDKSSRYNYEVLSSSGWTPVAFTVLQQGDVFRMTEKADGPGVNPTVKAGEIASGYPATLYVEVAAYKTKRAPIQKVDKDGNPVTIYRGTPCALTDPDAEAKYPVQIDARKATTVEIAAAQSA